MEFAIPSDHTVTGNDNRHGVGRIGTSHCARCVWPANLDRNIVIGACLAVGNAKDGLQSFALERLEKALRDRSFYITWLAIDPELNSLRSDARFRDLMRRASLPR